MLRSASELFNYTLAAQDGEIGRCKDFLFDDEFWTIRHMVADTGKWLPGVRVLISPASLGEPRWSDKIFPVGLTKDQIKEAPGVDEDAPLNRHYEKLLALYYGHSPYWLDASTWVTFESQKYLLNREMMQDQINKLEDGGNDVHLRSIKAVLNYNIHATDGKVGHVEDFVLDDENWRVRYLVVDTRNWIPGRKVLVSPMWVELVEWLNRKVQVDLTVEEVKESPLYDPSAPVNREYEQRLYDYYGRPTYWE